MAADPLTSHAGNGQVRQARDCAAIGRPITARIAPRARSDTTPDAKPAQLLNRNCEVEGIHRGWLVDSHTIPRINRAAYGSRYV